MILDRNPSLRLIELVAVLGAAMDAGSSRRLPRACVVIVKLLSDW